MHACSNLTLTFFLLAHPLVVSLQPDMIFITAQRGSSMTLSCNSSGCPYAHITWQNVTHQSLRSWKDTQAFVSQIGPWTIGLEDNRTFICKVECGSVVKSKHTELKVFCKYDTNVAYNTNFKGEIAFSFFPVNYSDADYSWTSLSLCTQK